ncbi:hypothetical protein AAH994_10480 [Weeksellaceae bacterium A-14]
MKSILLQMLFLSAFVISCKETKQENLNRQASLLQTSIFKENPLLEHVIASSINPKNKTMQTVYGNQIAYDYANSHANFLYPKGSILYAVTWQQQQDSVWFGANIPKEILSIEEVNFSGQGQPEYRMFSGRPLKEIEVKNSFRLTAIVQTKMAVSP